MRPKRCSSCSCRSQGRLAFGALMPLSIGIVALLVILVFSYRQTIKAYPSAGGAYIVTRDNFGLLPAQVAGVALLTDYILTVAVSVSAGVAAMFSACPGGVSVPRDHCGGADLGDRVHEPARGSRVGADLRSADVRVRRRRCWSSSSSGCASALLGDLDPVHAHHATVAAGAGSALGIFVLLHAFASGSTAMTGVEAISNGVPAFKPVEWRNARKVMAWLGVLLGVMFLGISFLTCADQADSEREGNGHQPGDARRRRSRPIGRRRVHRDAGRDDAHPRACGEHVLRRLPAPRQLPRPRSLPALATDPARPPARLRERHRRARGARHAC